MQLKFRTCSAHPAYGNVQPGGCAEVPEDLARELIDEGYAVPVQQQASSAPGGRETAMLAGEERAVSPPAQSKKRKAE